MGKDMKITKVKTKLGELLTPVSTELEAVIERMRSDKTKPAADKIALNAMASRLAMGQGTPKHQLLGTDELPYLIFGATFGHGGLDDVRTATGLLLLNVYCKEGHRQVMEMKRKVSQIPYTLLAFAGVSGVTLKVIVRCDYQGGNASGHRMADDYLGFMKDAEQSALRIYQALAGCEFLASELSLTRGCRMSYDPQLFYRPDAQAIPVVRQESDLLKPYEGTQVEDNGEVVWYPEYHERERLLLEYETCLQKAIDEAGDNADHCLHLLADYCAKAHLSEEGSVVRTQWKGRFRQIGDDVIRKVFRSAYKKPLGDKPLSQMNEKERIMRSIEEFLARRYQLRFNVVKRVVEFRRNDWSFKSWKPLTDRQLKSIVVEEMKEGGESWMNDIRTYIESAHVKDYNPILEFLEGCGSWDRKHDYIEDFARRLPTTDGEWPRYFHRWFLAMVAQALNMNRDYGNSMVPMLIGEQGYKKSSFCNAILPPSMREYYMNDIKLDNSEQVERVLGRMWLVNIDEYNAKTDREQAKIKRLLTEKDVQVRRMRSDQYTMTPRLCSFIATTNDPTPLPSGDGSRRYLCVEVTGMVDMSGRIPYKQMYAQAVSELRQDDALYWFTSDDEREIQQHNRTYQQVQPIEEVLPTLFEPTTERKRENLWQVKDVQKELGKHLRSGDIPNLKNLGASLKKMKWPRGSSNGVVGYYLKRRVGRE